MKKTLQIFPCKIRNRLIKFSGFTGCAKSLNILVKVIWNLRIWVHMAVSLRQMTVARPPHSAIRWRTWVKWRRRAWARLVWCATCHGKSWLWYDTTITRLTDTIRNIWDFSYSVTVTRTRREYWCDSLVRPGPFIQSSRWKIIQSSQCPLDLKFTFE